MKVEPVTSYRPLKYPCRNEFVEPSYPSLSKINKVLLTGILAFSGSLTGCPLVPFFATAGIPARPQPMSEQEVIQILKHEAEKNGVILKDRQDLSVKKDYYTLDLDLYEEKQIGAAVGTWFDFNKLNKFATSYYNDTSGAAKDSLYKDGAETGQEINYFLTLPRNNDWDNSYEQDLRQAFREFIEWLQSEGII